MFDFKNDIPLGIEYGDYDDQIIGSSQQWNGYYPVNGKLNSSTCWCPSSADKDKRPWIQVNLRTEKFMTSVTLQGRVDSNFNQYLCYIYVPCNSIRTLSLPYFDLKRDIPMSLNNIQYIDISYESKYCFIGNENASQIIYLKNKI